MEISKIDQAFFECNQCHSPYPKEGLPDKCPFCGGIYGLKGTLPFSLEKIDQGSRRLWKYKHSLLLAPGAPDITLGEGGTPLIWVDDDENHQVGLKLESLNPTGSYKDRGTSVLISQIIYRGGKKCVEDSSGNAGASLAAYTARCGIPSTIYVPDSTSEAKLRQIKMYGSKIIAVPGPRQNAADQVIMDLNPDTVYASHAYLPFGLPGIATIAYECWETLGDSPGTIICPVGHGGLLTGIIYGFESLYAHRLIQQMPLFIGAQPSACAPLVKLAKEGIKSINGFIGSHSIAAGTMITKPSRLSEIHHWIKQNVVEFVDVEEDKILAGYKALAQRGIWVEPTSALAWGAYQARKSTLPEPVILIMSGAGYKHLS